MSVEQKLLPIKSFLVNKINYRLWFWWLIFTLLSLLIIGLLTTKTVVFNEISEISDNQLISTSKLPEPFPLGVNPNTKTISENPAVTNFLNKNNIVSNHTKPAKNQTWLALLITKLQDMNWYQNLASPMSRILIIKSGDRAEQITSSFANILGWTKEQETEFLEKMTAGVPPLSEGKFYPGKYLMASDASPQTVALIVKSRFKSEILSRYNDEIESTIPLRDTIIIASLIEREAYDFEDMRYISGVIWNRLFINMRLQIDSSLQYVRGSNPNEPWWPIPVPNDKYLDSPYNTYQNKGLPPGPIANPSIDAIIATLNPRETDCLFYFYDSDSNFHCTPTYKEHVALLKKYFGKGK